jgi:hypothetical protein
MNTTSELALERTPLNIRLNHNLGFLPAGRVIMLPKHMALALVRRRLATAVGDAMVMPDIVVSEDDLPCAEIDLDPAWIAAGRARAMEVR